MSALKSLPMPGISVSMVDTRALTAVSLIDTMKTIIINNQKIHAQEKHLEYGIASCPGGGGQLSPFHDLLKGKILYGKNLTYPYMKVNANS
jgi:hypothetical protein